MRTNMHRNHMIDLLFPIALFFVFAISAVTVILLAANIYEETATASSLNDTSRTSLAYVSERIHQNDGDSSITLGTFDNCESVIIKHSGDKNGYTTYIYVHNNELKELFARNDAEASAESGKSIMQVNEFSITALSENLFQFSCTNKDGNTISTIVGVRSDN